MSGLPYMISFICFPTVLCAYDSQVVTFGVTTFVQRNFENQGAQKAAENFFLVIL